jgi:phage terminase large subunit-like protein
MNEKNLESGNGKQGNQPQPHYDSKLQPPYEFYEQGITSANRPWIELIRNARGRYFVVAVVVLALCKIACNTLEKSILGALVIALMILSIVFIPQWREDNTNVEQEENREKIEQIESGTGGNGPGQDRRITARNRGANPDGGSE